MKDWTLILLIFSIFVIIFMGWRAILQHKQKMEKEKEFVAKFLRGIFPDSATTTDISDYTGFDFLKVSNILYSLIKDKRVEKVEFGFISTELGNKRYPPKLRLIRCN